MGFNVVKGLDGDLLKRMWTIEGERVLTQFTGLDGDLFNLTWTSESEWVLTWLTVLDGDQRKRTRTK